MNEVQGKDARLRCRILPRGELVISIGIDVLAHAFINGPIGDRLTWDDALNDWDRTKLRVTDPLVFAREIVRLLNDEREDGSGPLTDLFDAAYQAALDDGAEGIYLRGELDDDEA